MRHSTPQSLLQVLDETGHLSTIQQRAVALCKLDQTVKQLLPKPLHAVIRVANYRQQVLIIEVSSASWLTRMRYEQQALCSALRQQGFAALSSIQLVINPKLESQRYQQQNRAQATVRRQLSTQSAILLQELAERSPKRLRQKLDQLAQHAKRSNNDQN